MKDNLSEIHLAGGCFWGTEHFLKQIHGVKDTEVGFANGKGKGKGKVNTPSYEEVCSGITGHTETVWVKYDKNEISLDFLLSLYYESIDPTSLNKQGNDRGTQYRTGIYYTDANDLPVIEESIKALAQNINGEIAVEVLPLTDFFAADDYHQDYLEKNPSGYCHLGKEKFEMARTASAKLVYKKLDSDELRSRLTEEQYDVTQKSATELAFKNKYWDYFEDGIYIDITTGEPLFLSTDKFESGCGWPSFSKPIKNESLNEIKDKTHGMIRVEVRSATGDSHLGHVFEDGPTQSGGLRYCINSASLEFVAKQDMQQKGYGDFIKLLL